MGKVRTSAIFYKRGINNNNVGFGGAVQNNYTVSNVGSFFGFKLNLPTKKKIIPGAPTLVNVEILNTQFNVSWTAPTNKGDGISYYTVIATPGNIYQSTTNTYTTFNNLTPYTSYTFRVFATNPAGNSALSDPSLSGFVYSNTPLQTPFFSTVSLKGLQNVETNISSIQFNITPKTGSITKPISATYSINYLINNSYVLNNTSVNLPVFGLYANQNNNVIIIINSNQGNKLTINNSIITQAWTENDPLGNIYKNPTIITQRDNNINLDYDFILMKDFIDGAPAPIVVDTDGEVRWVGSNGPNNNPQQPWNSQSQAFIEQNFYVTYGTSLYKINLTNGNPEFIVNLGLTNVGTGTIYDPDYINNAQHHNIDPGSRSDTMFICVNTQNTIETVTIECDTNGNIIKVFNFTDILSKNIIADSGGSENGFNIPEPLPDYHTFINSSSDWFHTNANCYWPSRNEFISSSRENFAIAVDYDNPLIIKWIFGQTDKPSEGDGKSWYVNFPLSLQKYALQYDVTNTLAPDGQHAVSISPDDNLLLFDDGQHSFYQTPAGSDRNYSAGRKYSINENTMTAEEIFTYTYGNPPIYSRIVSSFYQKENSYLADFGFAPDGTYLVGIDQNKNTAFSYKYDTTANFFLAWNAIMINLTNLQINN
jgi:hypothetical protein